MTDSPLEACGLCAGVIVEAHGETTATAKITLGIANQAHSAVRFVMNPYEQLQALELIESSQMDLIAIYHSHPTGPEVVSVTDIAEAAYAVVHIVWSPKVDDWQARGFWIEEGRVSEVALQIL